MPRLVRLTERRAALVQEGGLGGMNAGYGAGCRCCNLGASRVRHPAVALHEGGGGQAGGGAAPQPGGHPRCMLRREHRVRPHGGQ